ncbi:hypothetical protein [Acidovorax sp.]|uniref:hypothetical protein n=1 Tax=Acidovorax sp. TaxID=1872122 RepID=UPI003D08FD49
MSDVKPTSGNFEIEIRNKTAHVQRHFEFSSGTIDLKLHFTTTTPLQDTTVLDLHKASLRIAIGELQRLLDSAGKET